MMLGLGDLRNLLGVFSVAMLLVACSSPVPAVSPGQADVDSQTPAPMQKPMNLGQNLPVSAQVKVSGQVIQLEVARTVEQQAMGLMFRTSLADNRGMLFPFNPPRRVGFWMKNVAIKLDMVFLSNGRVAAIAANVPPCTADPCPTYGPPVQIDQVIELRGGRAAELGIRLGDRLVVQHL
jgi:uncharacterized membrane protein (UPF0127 family)